MTKLLTSGAPTGVAVRVFALFGSMAAWFAHLNVSYLLVPWSCRWGHTWALHLATVAFAAVAVASAVVAARLAAARPGDGLPADRPAARTAPFLGIFGALLGALFVLTILVQGLGNLVIDPCAR